MAEHRPKVCERSSRSQREGKKFFHPLGQGKRKIFSPVAELVEATAGEKDILKEKEELKKGNKMRLPQP